MKSLRYVAASPPSGQLLKKPVSVFPSCGVVKFLAEEAISFSCTRLYLQQNFSCKMMPMMYKMAADCENEDPTKLSVHNSSCMPSVAF